MKLRVSDMLYHVNSLTWCLLDSQRLNIPSANTYISYLLLKLRIKCWNTHSSVVYFTPSIKIKALQTPFMWRVQCIYYCIPLYQFTPGVGANRKQLSHTELRFTCEDREGVIIVELSLLGILFFSFVIIVHCWCKHTQFQQNMHTYSSPLVWIIGECIYWHAGLQLKVNGWIDPASGARLFINPCCT